MTHRILPLLYFLALSPCLRSADPYQETVVPILKQHCGGCHGAEEPKADLRLDNLSSDLLQDPIAAESWHDVLTVLQQHEMPPKEQAPLPKKQRQLLIDWIQQALQNYIDAKRSTGGQTVLRRMNRVEYQNTMTDLLGVKLDYASDLPPDELSRDGFSNNGSALKLSPLQLETYLAAARRGLRSALVDYPQPNVTSMETTESVADKGKGNWTNRLGRSGVFVLRSKEFPDEGTFSIRITAHAEIPDEAPIPQLQVRLGYRADTETPSRIVGTIDVADLTPRTFEFTGRIEEFPRQSRTQSKYPGLLIWLTNAYDDGKPAPKPVNVKGKDKKKKKTQYPEDPTFPKIVIDKVAFTAPVFQSWPPLHHQAILSNQPDSPDEELAAAKTALTTFATKAYRRPATPSDVENGLSYFESIRPGSESFISAIRETLAMTLISPEFLYTSISPKDSTTLDSYGLGSRLSYFLWSTMPDSELMLLAQSKRLLEKEILLQQANRLLDSPRIENFVNQFSEQWLGLAGVHRVAINPEFYPEFDPTLKQDMQRETQAFFGEILRNDLSAMLLIDAPFTMLNRPLAQHYGIPGPAGSSFQRVSLAGNAPRGGLLTHSSILLAGSNGEDSHPILRGVWLRDRLLGDPPNPPPPNVPNLEQDNIQLAGKSIKELLVLHRENDTCAQCHQNIDPWGIALEQFDAVGNLRTHMRQKAKSKQPGAPADAVAELPDGAKIDGIAQLKTYLLSNRKEQFARSLVRRMLSYALGRDFEVTDHGAVEAINTQFAASGYQLKTLVTQIICSPAFLHR